MRASSVALMRSRDRIARRRRELSPSCLHSCSFCKLTPRSHFNYKRRDVKAATARLSHGTKIARKQDMLEGTAVTDESSGSNSDEYDEAAISPPEGIMFSFDAKRAPSEGSQILNVALAKAVERFEERETVKLVKDEYDILDATGEVVPQPSSARKSRKGKSKAVAASEPEVDEDYEFV